MEVTSNHFKHGQDQNPLDKDLELVRLQQRVAQLEQENALLKQYFSFSLKDFATSSPDSILKSTEEIERQNYRFYQALMESNTAIAIQYGPEHIFQFANPAYEVVAGRGSERLLGLSMRQAFPDLEGQSIFYLMDEVVRTGQPFTAKEMPVQLVRQKNGEVEDLLFTFTYSPFFSIEGEVEGFIVYASEVTEEVKTKRTLELERQRLRQLFEDAPAIIAVLSGPDHVFELANPSYLQLVGRPQNAIIGQTVAQALPEVVEQGFINLLDNVYQNGQPFIGQETKLQIARPADNKLTDLFLNFVYQPIFASSNNLEVEGIFVHAVDVTEQVQARQQIEDLSRLKDEFLAIASHDLRTPITSIKGYIQLLQRNLSKYQQAQLSRLGGDSMVRENEAKFLNNSLQLVATVLNQTNRLNELVNRLLDFSQIAEGRLSLQYTEQVDLVKLVLDIVSAASLTSENHQILMQPATDDTIMISCDVTRLEQVLNNLTGNAIKYSPRDTTVTVGLKTVRSSQAQDYKEVVIWVRDEGYGISPEQQPYLFEQFYRVQNEQTASKEGLGLGLYISAEVVKLHGGRLWVESEVGKGSTFYVALPIQRPE